LIGREQEIQRIQEKLRAGNHCSVVGPHGSGKSFVLKYVREQLPVWCGWQEQEILSFDFRLIYTLKELHKEFVVQLGGQEAYEWRSLLRSKPPRLLVLDNLGGMNPGELGLKMRRWLRGIGDEGVKLLPISNEKLDVLFRKDDPNRDSPLANIDPLPVQLAPLSIDACRTIVQQRLSGIALDTDQFAEALRIPRQPKELLILCAARYEELRKGTK
jgi:hypothetical protein